MSLIDLENRSEHNPNMKIIDKILKLFGLMRISKMPFMIVPRGYTLVSNDKMFEFKKEKNGDIDVISRRGGGGGGSGSIGKSYNLTLNHAGSGAIDETST